MPNQFIKLETFAQAAYHKCECCSRVRDIFFRANIYDADTGDMLVGSFELCKTCGENMGKILNQKATSESVVTEFSFDK